MTREQSHDQIKIPIEMDITVQRTIMRMMKNYNFQIHQFV